MTTFPAKIQVRHGSAASAASNNPTLADGELAWDGNFLKVGDGSTPWNTRRPATCPILTPTTVKTATYTAAVGEMVRVDTTAGNVTVSLPSAPGNYSQVGVAKVDSSSNDVIVTRGGTDVFQAAGGSTTLPLPGTNKADAYTTVVLQYNSVDGVWVPISGFSTPSAGAGGSSIITGRGVFASRPAGTNVGDVYYCTDNGNEYRWNGTGWEVAASGPIPFTPPPSSGWTTTTLGSATIAADKDGRLITAPTNGGKAVRGEYRTLSPTSNYTLTVYIEPTIPAAGATTGGILLRNSAGALITFGMGFNLGWAILSAVKYTSESAASAVYGADKNVGQMGGAPYWLRVRDDGTTRFLEYSFNGLEWLLHFSVGRTDFLTPDQIGWCFDNDSSGATAYSRLRSWA